MLKTWIWIRHHKLNGKKCYLSWFMHQVYIYTIFFYNKKRIKKKCVLRWLMWLKEKKKKINYKKVLWKCDIWIIMLFFNKQKIWIINNVNITNFNFMDCFDSVFGFEFPIHHIFQVFYVHNSQLTQKQIFFASVVSMLTIKNAKPNTCYEALKGAP